MTRLEKYLLATASEIIEAETTNSRYFVLGNIKLRVSDHFSKTSDADIQIVVPYNGGSKYIVTIRYSEGRFLNWNAKQIQEFIPAYQIIKGLRSSIIVESNKPDSKKSAIEKVQLAMSDIKDNDTTLIFKGLVKPITKEVNMAAIERSVFRKEKSIWNISEIGALPRMIGRDLRLKSNASINEDIQIFLTCTSITYVEILNIYKTVVIDNKLTPTIKILQKAYSLISASVE